MIGGGGRRVELTMHDDHFVVEASDLASLTPAQRSVLTRLLIRRAREARARAIGQALLRLPRRLRGVLRRAHGRLTRRCLAQHRSLSASR
jgi:hypothetical protein